MKRGLDVVVGTPGRIIDHLERGNLKLGSVRSAHPPTWLTSSRFVILDEADEMLNFGFQDSVERILSEVVSEHQV